MRVEGRGVQVEGRGFGGGGQELPSSLKLRNISEV